MKTQLEHAKEGTVTREMKAVAEAEKIDVEALLGGISNGSIVIMSRGFSTVGIGKGLSTKVNVNLGTSSLKIDPDEEVKKAQIAQLYGADTITDLSMGGNIPLIRKKILKNTDLPITTVPIYQNAAQQGLRNISCEDIIKNIKEQAREGISSFVFHCIEKRTLEILKKEKRIMGVVSKGGSITSSFMLLTDQENPFVSNFDEILSIMQKHDIVLSLGNTMRSGCIHDKRDRAQITEIKQNAKLAKLANEAGVQAIIEGAGGHIHAGGIAKYVKFHKRISPHPLFVAGPLPTDIAVGYDHIAGSIGASMASGAGADYLCYITPSEHLGLPGPEQVRDGLVAFKIAAHIGDSIKYGISERDKNLAMSRAMLDWEGQMNYALDSKRAKELAPVEGPCTMCGDFCAIKLMKELGTCNYSE